MKGFCFLLGRLLLHYPLHQRDDGSFLLHCLLYFTTCLPLFYEEIAHDAAGCFLIDFLIEVTVTRSNLSQLTKKSKLQTSLRLSDQPESELFLTISQKPPQHYTQRYLRA